MSFLDYFKVPKVAKDISELLVNQKEKEAIILMKNDDYSYETLIKLFETNLDTDAVELIKSMYKRAVINKVEIETDNEKAINYTVADFYYRLPYFSQYEYETWLTVPKEIRDKIDEEYVISYAKSAELRLEQMQKNESNLIENAFLFTLDETLELIDSLEKQIYVVPCNCRSIADNCEKPKGVCLLFEDGINTEWDRGHGRPLTKEEAKDIVIDADKKGLMHTSETDHAVCNCCGCCCYPIRASKKIGTTGVWPKRRYDIIWNEEKCVHCGKCARVCNFEAFVKENKKVEFIETKCIGCTICYSNCPVDAIEIRKID